jgi:hypothetical protein
MNMFSSVYVILGKSKMEVTECNEINTVYIVLEDAAEKPDGFQNEVTQ